jgi:hypothetical protein
LNGTVFFKYTKIPQNKKIKPLNIYLQTTNPTKKFPKTYLFIHTLLNEKSFIHRFNQNFEKPNLVLSKANYYKMDNYSSVTADRYRGNIYHRYGFLYYNLFNKANYLTKSNIAARASTLNPFYKISNQSKISKFLG